MIQVIKCDPQGGEVWRYPGEVVSRDRQRVLVRAVFTRGDLDFFGLPLRRGDVFLEAYYRERWYNIFEIYDGEERTCKGWYCNITRPAAFRRWDITYQDLALDLLMLPGGPVQLLDEDEFHALQLPAPDQAAAWTAVAQVRRLLAAPGFHLLDHRGPYARADRDREQ